MTLHDDLHHDQRHDLAGGYVVYLTRYASGWAMALYDGESLVSLHAGYASDVTALTNANDIAAMLRNRKAA